jgi:membrane associated rhomboid family serine protease
MPCLLSHSAQIRALINLANLVSGAIYAALSYYATIFPTQQFLLFFVVPVPAWAAVGGIFAVSLGLLTAL